MRIPLIAGNWKMYTRLPESAALVRGILQGLPGTAKAEVAVCPPFPSLGAVAEIVKGSVVRLGAQNVYWETQGAYTGEVSAEMLAACGCRYVIIGHSERRTLFGETNATVNRKLRAAQRAGLVPICCIGETLEEREAGRTAAVIDTQFREGLAGIPLQDGSGLVIAYEPVWAIGTGRNATPAQAEEVHGQIRGLLRKTYAAAIAEAVRIQYGGSVKPENARELLAQPDIDGALVGGASLKADSFLAIIAAA